MHLFEKLQMMNYKMMFGNIWIKLFHQLYLIWKYEKIDKQIRKNLFIIKTQSIILSLIKRITTDSSQDNIGGITTTEQIELIERGTGNANDNPAVLAETVLRDLFCRAHLNNINACVQPILT